MRSFLRYRPAWRQLLSPTPLTTNISPHTHRPLLSHHAHPHSTSTSSADAPTTPTYPDSVGSGAEHNDLASYAAYAERTGLDVTSGTYVGTQYEYAVVAALATLGFTLQRIGGRNDYGIDLLGTWQLPTPPTSNPHLLRIIVQCKASPSQATRIGPQYVRELEGAFAGAPPGWRSHAPGSNSSVLGFLVAQKPATKGVRDALGRSRWPMGFVSCSRDGRLEQMLWNQKAEERGLEGLGVGVRFDGESEQRLVLTWRGKPCVSDGEGQTASGSA
ncbi:hypothetical protein F4804DRAFT_299123 [Jackrogersella minutella]|nr:hypothetical protein F4804DRAFT_299123 [Jackrogersella minutella]